jgi:hypothetical protein
MAIYGKLTQDEALALSYWDAITSWGINPASYPQPYYPSSLCGCAIPPPTPSGTPPLGIPIIIVGMAPLGTPEINIIII